MKEIAYRSLPSFCTTGM